jgi:5-methylcytosine-specific restriction endonuclease McrA
MCRICGSTQEIGTHHIINKSLGGDDSLHNLITLCFSHHRNLHDGTFDLTEWLINKYESHPVPEWFRWKEVIGELTKRGKKC